jgi:hypothetical protein
MRPTEKEYLRRWKMQIKAARQQGPELIAAREVMATCWCCGLGFVPVPGRSHRYCSDQCIRPSMQGRRPSYCVHCQGELTLEAAKRFETACPDCAGLDALPLPKSA